MAIFLYLRENQASPITNYQYDFNLKALRTAIEAITPGGSGTVTSVALTAPNIFSVAGSPVTTTGTLALSLATQTANRVWAGPTTGSAAAPTFRALVLADIGFTISTARGGTGASSQTASRLVTTDGSGNIVSTSGVTSTEAGYLSGVTSAIQTQLDAKEPTITTLAINKGGTGATTAATARVALLPSYTSNALKILRVNAGATDVEWVTSPSGIASINADTTSAQTIVAASTGTDFTVSTAAGVTTLAIPSASATARGLVTTAAQTIAGQKTLSSTPIISTLTAARVVFAGASKELVDASTLTYVVASDYLLTGEAIENKIDTLNANTTLDINYMFIHSEQVSDVTYMLPTIASVPAGKVYGVKDALGACSTHSITIQAQPGELLENSAGGTVIMATTDFSCVWIKKSTNAGGNSFWNVISAYGTLT